MPHTDSTSGMGALLTGAGAFFRVWAPHAESVSVAGTFNDWQVESHPLTPEGNGNWSGEVAGVSAGDRYKFVLRRGGEQLWRTDPYARQLDPMTGYEAVLALDDFDWIGDAFASAPLNELVIYELHLGTFAADPPGEVPLLRKALEKLSYLRHLGVNAIELMPPAEFPMDFSWGYHPAHLFAVESSYGSPADLKVFVRAAHAQGMAVILDVVYTHFGPEDPQLWRFDGWYEGNGGGIYFYNDERAFTPWGNTRPDYGCAAVRQYLRDNAIHWLREYHVDGLRFEGAGYMRTATTPAGTPIDLPEGASLLQWIAAEVRALPGTKLLFAGDDHGDAWIVNVPDKAGAGCDAQWHLDFSRVLRQVLTPVDDGRRSMAALADALQQRYLGDAYRRVIYSESHDDVAGGRARFPHEIDAADACGWAARKRSTLAAALVMTAPGIPLLFQGQEFLESEWSRAETPLDWSRARQFSGILQLYTDLVHLRLNATGVTRGLQGQSFHLLHFHEDNKVLAFHRFEHGGPRDSTVVVVNCSAQIWAPYRIGLPAEGVWRVRFNSDATCYSPDFGGQPGLDVFATGLAWDGQAASAELGIGPYSALILSQDY